MIPRARVSGFAALALVATGPFACIANAETPLPLRGTLAFSANVAIVSDYRGRGITVNDHSAAIQGGFDLSSRSGFGAGVWASSIAGTDGASAEVDWYVSTTIQVGSFELAIGGTAYTYPGAEQMNYGEAQFSATRTIGPIDATFGANYAWRQRNLGDRDNLYLFANGAMPLAAIDGVPLTLNASYGREFGALAIERVKQDWSIGLVASLTGVQLGMTYVDTDISDKSGRAAGVISVERTF